MGSQHPGQPQRAAADPRRRDGLAREITDADERALALELICDTVVPTDDGKCTLHLRGLPTRTKIQDLHRYWFETGIPIAIDLKETRP